MTKTLADPQLLRAEKRRQRAVELRMMGMTYQQIADTISNTYADECPPSYDSRHAWTDVMEEINLRRRNTEESVNAVIEVEVLRLDNLMQVAMVKAMQGDLKAIDKVLKIMERRSRLLGLDKPTTHNVRDWRSELLDLVKQGRITIEQVREEIGDELTQRLIESGSISLFENRENDTRGDEAVIDSEFVA